MELCFFDRLNIAFAPCGGVKPCNKWNPVAPPYEQKGQLKVDQYGNTPGKNKEKSAVIKIFLLKYNNYYIIVIV